MTTRQYARLVGEWVASIGLDASKFGTHSLRRTKAVLIYRRTGNLRAVQLLLGHSKIESSVRYLGIEVDDAIEIAEKIDIKRIDGIPQSADVVGDTFRVADRGSVDVC
jgi:integrase